MEDVWRREAPHVLGALVRRYGDFDACEDAVQEALLQAAVQWPRDGEPRQPRGWLLRTASRRLVDARRSEGSRRRREERVQAEPEPGATAADDQLQLLVLCCHPALTPASQVALTLRAVAGLTTAQVAAAFLVPEPTMAQRISRAKATLREAGARFEPPAPDELEARLPAVRHVLYLVFTEGHTSSGGADLVRHDLAGEALRLTRDLHRRLPDDPETAGLLALILLLVARLPARTDVAGDLVPLAQQDRSRWDTALTAEGIALIERTLPRGAVGRFQLEAAIAAVHAEAADAGSTDWPQVVVLYAMLDQVAPGTAVTLARAVALAEADGPQAGLRLVDPLLADRRTARLHRVHAVRAHLLERAGRREEAVAAYREAARLTTSIPEQRYLNRRAKAAG
ncbi:RNA polymerase sigma factor [Nocardioides mangrovicus]|uniref:RNA polymerase sigma factor n=1 Tax=Nocardioides mangrovicus TaxID=2478913 RepID=A0A3L8P351_9ACTN|nr:RNA polymerase sigma factor [Nocardioides mangrovicus]